MLSLTLALIPILATALPDSNSELTAWRADYEARLRRPNGWLSVAGLFWLQEGTQTIGSGKQSKIQLPASAPETYGEITLKGGQVTVTAKEGTVLSVNGKVLADSRTSGLKSDAEGSPDKLQIGDLTLAVIKRGGRLGLRLWDPNSQARQKFEGCKWFAPAADLVIKAKFVPHKAGKTLPITSILGDIEPNPNPGYVEFKLQGKTQKLEAIQEGDGLFFIFKDGTSGKETYGAGRFLNTDAPKDGFVMLDFNRAVNPPCAMTDFATCPLPPAGNTLKVRIVAGELGGHHGM